MIVSATYFPLYFPFFYLLLLLVWHAPLGVHSTKRRHQSPEWTILRHSNCYRLIQGEIVKAQVLLDSLHPCSTRTSWWSPVLRRVSSYDTPGICLVWHSRNVAEQRKMPCLDNSRQAWLPGCLSHLVIPHVMVPFDSQQLSQTPLVEGVNLQYVSLGDCPALRAIQEDR